jgi:hypothetical protein
MGKRNAPFRIARKVKTCRPELRKKFHKKEAKKEALA